VVYDSRSGKAVEHQLGDVGKRILECLAKPKDLSLIALKLKNVSETILENEVSFLKERGLVFQEGTRFFSIVLPRKGSSYRKHKELEKQEKRI